MFLHNVSLLLSLVFAARENNIDPHLQAERELLKLVHVHEPS